MTLKTAATALLASLSLIVATTAARAEEHALGTITGPGIDLKAYDHAIAGQIKDFVIWGAVDEATFSSELIMRKDGQVIRAFFKREDGKVGGVIRHSVESRTYETSIYLVRMNPKEQQLILNVNGQEVTVSVTADAFADGHFMNPTYRTVIDGQELRYTFQGKACYGYSLHLAYLIVGAYIH